MGKIIKKIFRAVYKVMIWFSMIQIAGIVLVISLQVFCRYVLGSALRWPEEVALILMIWQSFISMYIGVNKKLHLTMEVFTTVLPENIEKNVVPRITYLSTFIFGILLAYYGYLLTENAMLSTLPSIRLPSAVEYVFVPISGLLIAYDSFMDFFGIDKEDKDVENEITAEVNQNA